MYKIIRRTTKTGLPPGSMIFTGEQRTEHIDIQVFDYDDAQLRETRNPEREDLYRLKDSLSTTWINIDGLHDVAFMEQLSVAFGINHLVIEDILSTHQRPKIEFDQDYLFIVLQMLRPIENGTFISEQVSLILRKGMVITFQEAPGDVFDPVRERLRANRGVIRKSGADHLAYSLIDVIVDNYFVVLEEMGNRLEILETQVLKDDDKNIIQRIFELNRQLLDMRKSTWPLREVVSVMQRRETPLIRKHTVRFISDLYDHVIQVIDTMENFREMMASILEIHLSITSNRLNEVMKVLTVIATIFIPLSFLASVYGMNFDTAAGPFNMPELELPYGYAIFWGMALFVAGGLLLFFRKKRWL